MWWHWTSYFPPYTAIYISLVLEKGTISISFAFFSQLRATMSATVQVLSMVCVRRRTFASVALDT